MKTAYIYRLESTDEGTPGIFACDGRFWHSLELPGRQNKPNISRIPAGEYVVQERYSNSFKRITYWVKDVKDRTWILIHGANFAGDESKGWQTHLQGCITLGKKVGRAKNRYGKKQKCVFSSRMAIREMIDYMNHEEFTLVVLDV